MESPRSSSHKAFAHFTIKFIEIAFTFFKIGYVLFMQIIRLMVSSSVLYIFLLLFYFAINVKEDEEWLCEFWNKHILGLRKIFGLLHFLREFRETQFQGSGLQELCLELGWKFPVRNISEIKIVFSIRRRNVLFIWWNAYLRFCFCWWNLSKKKFRSFQILNKFQLVTSL